MAPLAPWIEKYHSDVKKYGPLPRGWRVEETARHEPHYICEKGGNSGNMHPSSPKGRNKGLPYGIQGDHRKNFPGIPQPPIVYNAALHMWEPHSTPLKALTSALSEQLNDITETAVGERLDTVKKNDSSYTNVLYHPADRILMISEFEPYLSAVARTYNRNLIVVSPCAENAQHWNLIWSTTCRIPVLARWSTGRQDDLKPIILGFLPLYNESSARKGLWYVIKPYGPRAEEWITLWKRPDWSDWYKSCGWHKGLTFEDFAWVMVAAHRSISLGCTIPDDQLGEWMVQYGRRLYSNLTTGPARRQRELRVGENFEFDTEKKSYKGPSLTYDKLGADILMYKSGTPTRIFAEQWDAAIAAWYRYKAARNLTGGGPEWSSVGAFLEDVASISVDGKLRQAQAN